MKENSEKKSSEYLNNVPSFSLIAYIFSCSSNINADITKQSLHFLLHFL